MRNSKRKGTRKRRNVACCKQFSAPTHARIASTESPRQYWGEILGTSLRSKITENSLEKPTRIKVCTEKKPFVVSSPPRDGFVAFRHHERSSTNATMCSDRSKDAPSQPCGTQSAPKRLPCTGGNDRHKIRSKAFQLAFFLFRVYFVCLYARVCVCLFRQVTLVR